MLVAKERHDLGRPNDWGYPVRAIRTPEFLYVRNYEPDRWPAGNPETGYRNVDDSPTKHAAPFRLRRILPDVVRQASARRSCTWYKTDADNVNNLATDPKYAETKRRLREKMEELLRSEGDPARARPGRLLRHHRVRRAAPALLFGMAEEQRPATLTLGRLNPLLTRREFLGTAVPRRSPRAAPAERDRHRG